MKWHLQADQKLIRKKLKMKWGIRCGNVCFCCCTNIYKSKQLLGCSSHDKKLKMYDKFKQSDQESP